MITDRFFGKQGAFATDLAARTENEGSKAVWAQRSGTLPRPWLNPQVTEIHPGYTVQHEHWQINSCDVPHAQPWLDCMAYRIENKSGSFVYCGDSGSCTEPEELIRHTNVLLHWLYRLSSETSSDFITRKSPPADDIAKMAERAKVGKLLFTHLRPHMNTPQHHKDILHNARTQYKGHVSIAEDLDVINLAEA